jgi:glycosyltransferase involved in cell wall biosynthesis
MPTVSVIMPAYKVEAYIGEAIESVIAQTYTDWELIVIDDGSPDESGAIAASYAASDPRIRVARQANGGLSSARNHGVRLARGEFMAILDSDDLWQPSFLAAQNALLQQHPEIDVVTGNAWNLGGWRDGTPWHPYPDPRPQPTLSEILRDEESIFIMSVIRRRVFESIGGFDESLRSNEDYHFWLRAALAGFKFMRNDRPLGFYRRREDSLSSSDVRMMRGILRVYEKFRPLLLATTAELAVLDAQVARFQCELLAAEARDAIAAGHINVAASRLAELFWRRGGAAVGVVSLMARWTPRLLTRAYQMRRTRQEASL